MSEKLTDQPVLTVPFIAGLDTPGLRTIKVCPDGKVKSKSGSFVLDEEVARLVCDEFAAHKTDLPIDFEHQTLGGEHASPTGRAPASGWISKLWFDAGRGLMAFVRWTDEARTLIRADHYRYLSPVLVVRKSDRHAVSLHSVALTNKPAIPGMERVAASVRQKAEGGRQKAETGTETQDREVVSMGDEGTPDVPAPDVTLSSELSSLGIASDLPAKEIIKRLLKIISELKKTNEELKEKLGEAEASEEVASSAMGNMSAEVEQLKADAWERDSEEFIANAVKAGKLLSANKEELEEWKGLFADDRERAERMMANKTIIVPQGRTTPPPGGQAGTARRTLVVNANRQFSQDVSLQKTTSREAYVNQVLIDAGKAKLTEGELILIG